MLQRTLHTRASHPKALAGLVNGVLAGERLQLARAITLVESQHPDDHKQADLLLDQVMLSMTLARIAWQHDCKFKQAVLTFTL
jgi:transposase